MNRDEKGANTGLVLTVVVLLLLVLGFGAFSAWAFGERQTYKNKSDEKVAVAVKDSTTAVKAAQQKVFAEQEKSPFRVYTGPAEYGSVKITHPKTWSIYVASDAAQPLDIYMDPGYVPSTQNQAAAHALRVQVDASSYSQSLSEFTSGDQSQVKAAPYALPSVPKVIGTRLEGQVVDQKKGVLILLPLRDKTLKIWTESDSAKADFDNIILKNFTFSP